MREGEKKIKRWVLQVQKTESLEERKRIMTDILDIMKPFRFALAKKFANKGVEFDDIVQQIDVKLIESIYDYDEKKDPSALRHLVSKARNGVWNFYRREMNYFDEKKRVVSLDHVFDYGKKEDWYTLYELGESYGMQANPFDEESIVQRLAMEEEMEKLTPHQREILLLYFFDDQTQYSIAEELNINQGNVSRAKNRAIAQLKANITPADDRDDTTLTSE